MLAIMESRDSSVPTATGETVEVYTESFTTSFRGEGRNRSEGLQIVVHSPRVCSVGCGEAKSMDVTFSLLLSAEDVQAIIRGAEAAGMLAQGSPT